MPKPVAAKKGKPAAKPKPATKVKDDVMYPEIVVANHTDDGDGPLTIDMAKDLLGWTDDAAAAKAAGVPEPLFKDMAGKYIYCLRNNRNRPFYAAHAKSLMQNHLNKRWQVNGETIIISQTAQVHGGQHRLVSFIWAEQERQKNPEHWKAMGWDGPVTFPTILVFGISDDDAVVNTIDTGKGRSNGDMLYRSDEMVRLFPESGKRRAASGAMAFTVRYLWARTGAKNDAFSPILNHSEVMDFIARHPKSLEALKHVLEEDKDGHITKFVKPGMAAGMMYLMGAGNTNREDYVKESLATGIMPTEDGVEFSLWAKACEFWAAFASPKSTQMLEARQALSALLNADTGEVGTRQEKAVVLAKAWAMFSKGKKFTRDQLAPNFTFDGDGYRTLTDDATFGGIDVGEAEEAAPANDEEPGAEAGNKPAKLSRKALDAGDGKPMDLREELASMRVDLEDPENTILFFKSGSGWKMWDPDTKNKKVMKMLGLTPAQHASGLMTASFGADKFEANLSKLTQAGYAVATVVKEEGKPAVVAMANGKDAGQPTDPEDESTEDASYEEVIDETAGETGVEEEVVDETAGDEADGELDAEDGVAVEEELDLPPPPKPVRGKGGKGK